MDGAVSNQEFRLPGGCVIGDLRRDAIVGQIAPGRASPEAALGCGGRRLRRI